MYNYNNVPTICPYCGKPLPPAPPLSMTICESNPSKKIYNEGKFNCHFCKATIKYNNDSNDTNSISSTSSNTSINNPNSQYKESKDQTNINNSKKNKLKFAKKLYLIDLLPISTTKSKLITNENLYTNKLITLFNNIMLGDIAIDLIYLKDKINEYKKHMDICEFSDYHFVILDEMLYAVEDLSNDIKGNKNNE